MFGTHILRGAMLAALVFITLSGCGAPQGPRIRFAQASPAQLASAESEEVVWFEFRQGDSVPMVFLVKGIVDAEADTPVRLTASRDFWVVSFRDGRQFFSFDGKSLYGGQVGKFGLFLTSDGQGPATGIMLYIGRPQDAPPELR
jgi:hypothetical protein